jgi:hypothetical protein
MVMVYLTRFLCKYSKPLMWYGISTLPTMAIGMCYFESIAIESKSYSQERVRDFRKIGAVVGFFYLITFPIIGLKSIYNVLVDKY